MNKIKLTALILAALLSCSALAGCKNEETKEPDDTQEIIDTQPTTNPAPYEKGVVENNVYRNEAADLTLRIPVGWNAKSDYDLSALMGITYDFEDPSVNLDQISKLADIYDMIATDITEDSSIMVLMQDLVQHGLSDISAAEYLDIMKGQFISETATFETEDITEVSYSGNTYSMMKVESTPNKGTSVTQYFYTREANGRMISIMITCPSDDPISPDTIFA